MIGYGVSLAAIKCENETVILFVFFFFVFFVVFFLVLLETEFTANGSHTFFPFFFPFPHLSYACRYQKNIPSHHMKSKRQIP